MNIVSFREINQSQLSSVPINVGCITVCIDSGRVYKDTETEHELLSEQILFVNELPLAPLSNKFYYYNDNLYLYINDDYINISKNHTHEISDITELQTTLDSLTSDISLPQVTGEDNGKILKVINGEWAIATLVDETYYISDESDNLLTDEEDNSLIIQ